MPRQFPVVLRGTPAFQAALDRLLARGGAKADVESSVRQTIAEVRARGDAALAELTRRFEGRTLESIEIPLARIEAAEKEVAPAVRKALETACERIRAFHE